ncbi:molybdopterin molybdotransferase [Devosia crocina]|uniref:Molybdopterin molybdenumtransferase n=1 Tax=Devosia crocina TaxID=429728 RepID=A0A1I7NDG2_9HYPH|nr:gephyrin-like molybdotransferase Glp [Devosia crocina]SFV32718.1 molybdopterin molybdotransferase [Devosia crocina]
MNLLPVDEALNRILGRVPPVAADRLALSVSAGRVLAAPIIATHDQPPFDASAMDGYAVRAGDVADDRWLQVTGMSQAGAGFAGTLGAGEAVRIFTGAPVPPGADTVIMQEEAERSGNLVRFTAPARRGHSIRPRGYDFATGREILAAGTRLGPFQLAAAAAANAGVVSVARRPRLALLATGDELVLPGTPLGPDQIVASNSVALAASLAPFAHDVRDWGIARDSRNELDTVLDQIFADAPDIVVTTGGASVGEHDLVQAALLDRGVELDFWRINMRPGKPLMFGSLGNTLVFGLPGNPVSAMVTSEVFVKPALRHWLGLPQMAPLRLPLLSPTPRNTARRHFMRAQVIAREGTTGLLPITETDSGHTSSLAMADALIVQPEHDPGQEAGTVVSALEIG